MGNSSSPVNVLNRVVLEGLESRCLLSAGTSSVSYANFASTNGLVLNGFGSNPATAKNELILTTDSNYEARSVWTTQEVGTQTFSTSFLFQIAPTDQEADGFTFTLQNHGTGSLGNEGSSVGYRGIARSVAIQIVPYNYDLNTFLSGIRFLSGGEDPDTVNIEKVNPVNFYSGDKFRVTISYNGTTLSVSIADTAVPADTFSDSEVINLQSALDGDAAYAGFTAGTGLYVSTQKIFSWSYTGTDPVVEPSLTLSAGASPSPVTGTSTDLTCLATSGDGDGSLTYTWSTLAAPSGAKAIIYSFNGNDIASNTTADFSKDGNYIFQCTVTDINGNTLTSDVDVDVQQTATQMKISPHGVDVVEGSTQQFLAVVVDQFHHAMRSQPTIDYSILSGNGGITAEGVYHAAHQLGHAEIQAQGDGFTVTDGLTVVK